MDLSDLAAVSFEVSNEEFQEGDREIGRISAEWPIIPGVMATKTSQSLVGSVRLIRNDAGFHDLPESPVPGFVIVQQIAPRRTHETIPGLERIILCPNSNHGRGPT